MLPPNPTHAPRGGGAWREDLAVERIAAAVRAAFPDLAATADDDAAVVEHGGVPLLICTDAAVEGVHVDTALFPEDDLGYRATVATLSDLAAMGGVPLGVVVAICARSDADVEAIERGAIEACVASGSRVLGGNLSMASTTTVAVAGLGVATGAAVRRSGAKPGDQLFVTAPLGGSAAGLRARRLGALVTDEAVMVHRRPTPRLAAGQAAARAGASAMIDVSDGLARDLSRMASASGVGVELDDVPVAPAASLPDALGGGEDYELVIAHSEPTRLIAAFDALGLTALIPIGRVVAEPSRRTLRGEPMGDDGWRHGAPRDQEGR